MENQKRNLIALQKAISSHEQAASALTDLMSIAPDELFRAMLARIEQNLADLQAAADASAPDDQA